MKTWRRIKVRSSILSQGTAPTWHKAIGLYFAFGALTLTSSLVLKMRASFIGCFFRTLSALENYSGNSERAEWFRSFPADLRGVVRAFKHLNGILACKAYAAAGGALPKCLAKLLWHVIDRDCHLLAVQGPTAEEPANCGSGSGSLQVFRNVGRVRQSAAVMEIQSWYKPYCNVRC